MVEQYVLAPQAARDLIGIWRYLKNEGDEGVANHVQNTILDKIVRLSKLPLLGHLRVDLTKLPVRFYLVYSYFIIYWPETKPLEVISILHSRRDVADILYARLV